MYKDVPYTNIDQFPIGAVGFVYIIRGPGERYYIGKKALYHKTVRPPLAGRVNKRRGRKVSDWLTYHGSSASLSQEIARVGHDHFTREIISLHHAKGELNIAEAMLQLSMDCLNDDRSYNQHISLRMRRHK